MTYIGDFGEIKQAIDAAEMALALDANLASTYPLLGRLYAKAQQPERTAALVQQAMRLSPRDPNMGAWLYVMGSSQLRMGRYDEAIDTFSKSLAANPDLNGGRLNLTAAYLGAGRDVEARKTLDEARRLTIREDRMPESPDEQILIMRVQLGLLRRGRWIEAITGWKFRAGARRVLEAFQRDENLPQTGIFDEATLARLDVTAPAVDRSSK